MHSDLSAIDLENIDFDDVLEMHRGWRRSEMALKDATDELKEMTSKCEFMQGNHARFLAQIESLESVKDLTVVLQSQGILLRRENSNLKVENAQLNELMSRTVQSQQDSDGHVTKSHEDALQAQSDAKVAEKLYQEVASSHKELEIMLLNEVASRTSAETQIVRCDEVISGLRAENSSVRLKLEATLIRMNQCDHELAHASLQLSKLADDVAQTSETNERLLTKIAEVDILKRDISRLLKLIENNPASGGFLDRWHVSDGMSFMGVESKVRKSRKSPSSRKSSASNSPYRGHDVSLEDRGEVGSDSKDIKEQELAHLRRLHSVDEFPLTADFEEESDNWVPRKAVSAGFLFLEKKIPHVTPRVITDFLRDINKIWLEREKRMRKETQAHYESKISDLKRQLSHQKPYKGVIAENLIRHLKTQVHQEHEQNQKYAKPRGRSLSRKSPKGFYDEFDDPGSWSDGPRRGKRFGCTVCDAVFRNKNVNKNSHSGSPIKAAMEKLLNASLNSSDTTCRHCESFDMERQSERRRRSGSEDQSHYISSTERTAHPSEPYLRGALWLGRNISMVIQLLAESLDTYWTKFLPQVIDALSDQNIQRSCERLSDLLHQSKDDATALVNKSRARAREILQSVSNVTFGDIEEFKALLGTLPIESSLQPGYRMERSTPDIGGFYSDKKGRERGADGWRSDGVDAGSGSDEAGGGYERIRSNSRSAGRRSYSGERRSNSNSNSNSSHRGPPAGNTFKSPGRENLQFT